MGKYITVKDLEVYKLAREISKLGWKIYKELDWQTRKILGNQFISAIDSVGANIAEGYGRFHYLDKIRFYYNARGSLLEALHWVELLFERELVDKEVFEPFKKTVQELHIRLNLFIKTTHEAKNKSR